jgi:hypothetical protein
LTLGDLRAHLEAYHEEWNGQELALRPPGLIPSPGLDRRHVDLFRRETLAFLDQSGELDPPARRRWRSFVLAGIGRLAAAEPRRELARLLVLAGGPAEDAAAKMTAPAGLRAAAAEAAVEAARCAGEAVKDQAGAEPRAPSGLGERILATTDRLGRPGDPDSRGSEDIAVGELLPAAGFGALWRHLLAAGRFLRPGDGGVRWLSAPRPGAFPLQVPADVVLVVPGHGGQDGYRVFLRAAGEALAWAHLPRHLPVEDRRLPADGGASIYGRLLARRLQDRIWLAGHGIDGSRGEAVQRQALRSWRHALWRLSEAAGAERSDPEEHPRLAISGWDPGLAEPVAAACGAGAAAAALESERIAALLDDYLLTRHGHRWDEQSRAADLLRDLWSEGWRRPLEELLSSLGTEDPNGEILLDQLRP